MYVGAAGAKRQRGASQHARARYACTVARKGRTDKHGDGASAHRAIRPARARWRWHTHGGVSSTPPFYLSARSTKAHFALVTLIINPSSPPFLFQGVLVGHFY